MEISKEDWKHYTERLPKWQEHYMNLLNNEYKKLFEKFWELEKRLEKMTGSIQEL